MLIEKDIYMFDNSILIFNSGMYFSLVRSLFIENSQFLMLPFIYLRIN